MLSKKQRLQIVIERLEAAPNAGSEKEVFSRLKDVLNSVENEFSEAPYNPHLWESDGRMYPPQEDNRRAVEGQPSVCRYRSVSHQTFIGKNGSIRIETIKGISLLDKPGRDGKRILELKG